MNFKENVHSDGKFTVYSVDVHYLRVCYTIACLEFEPLKDVVILIGLGFQDFLVIQVYWLDKRLQHVQKNIKEVNFNATCGISLNNCIVNPRPLWIRSFVNC